MTTSLFGVRVFSAQIVCSLLVFPAALSLGSLATLQVNAAEPLPTSDLDQSNALSQRVVDSLDSSPSQESSDPSSNQQVTSVSQLSDVRPTDVRPTDWAFQALQSLVERYGCIAGYPDRTYRGNRALTRYEFAAGLNACLNRVNELIAASTADLVKKEDLVALQRLQEEFAAELSTLRGRVDALEARTTTLQKQQFSTTTKLQGEVIFSVAGAFGDDRALNTDQQRIIDAAPAATREAVRNGLLTAGGSRRSVQDNPIFSDRARVNLITSFTGKDRLYTRLEANNTTAFNTPITGTNETRLGFDTTTNADNSVQLGKANYQFPLGQGNIIIDAIGGEFFSNFYTFNPYFENAATGAVSRFGRFSPIYRAINTSSGSNTGAGISANFKFGKAITVSAGYLARRAYDPAAGRGLYDGSYSALAQLAFQPTKNFGLGLTYAHSYFSGGNNDVAISGAYGSAFANQPFGAGVGNTATNPLGVATSANHFGIEATYRLTPGFSISGWGLYTQATAENGRGLTAVNTGDKTDIWSWAIALAFPDLLKKGNVGGIIFGQPPKVTNNDYGVPGLGATTARRQDEDTSYHLEVLYQYQVTNNISITPGFFVVFNPEGNSNNDPLYVGVVRTTFKF